MKQGLLFTNHFLASPSFDTLYGLFDEAGAACGVTLSRATGGDAVAPFDKHPAKDSDFVIFWDKDIAAARRILERDHDGLTKVKERVIEYLAVKKLNPDLKNQILCLVGPPGVWYTHMISLRKLSSPKSSSISSRTWGWAR